MELLLTHHKTVDEDDMFLEPGESSMEARTFRTNVNARDAKGWLYAERFPPRAHFWPTRGTASAVRRRRWQRTVVRDPVTPVQQVSVLWHEHQTRLSTKVDLARLLVAERVERNRKTKSGVLIAAKPCHGS